LKHYLWIIRKIRGFRKDFIPCMFICHEPLIRFDVFDFFSCNFNK